MEKGISKVRLAPLTQDHSVTVENVKEHMSKNKFKVHLEKGKRFFYGNNSIKK